MIKKIKNPIGCAQDKVAEEIPDWWWDIRLSQNTTVHPLTEKRTKGNPMTLTREQIKNSIKFRKENWNECNLDLDEFEALCQMALNSLPIKFDPEDESTWPEDGAYLAWYQEGGGGCYEILAFHKGKWLFLDAPENEVVWRITHWMEIPPIPKVEE